MRDQFVFFKNFLNMAFWLGPLSSDEKKPGGFKRKELVIPVKDRSIKAWLYIPNGKIQGVFLMAPGFHFLGPADERFVRFNSILASSGFMLLCPFIEDYLDMKVLPRTEDDFKACFDVLESLPEKPRKMKPGVFSISFGSLLAVRLAGHKNYKDRVGGLSIFGGYANWDETLRYFLSGDAEGEFVQNRDPLCRPAVFLHLLDSIEPKPEDPEALREAWVEYIKKTWPDPLYLENDRYKDCAREMSKSLEESKRDLFLKGCLPGREGLDTALNALDKMKEKWDYLDPLAYAKDIHCPVTIIHGKDDGVIPVNQVYRFKQALRHNKNVTTCVTGLFSHSQNEGQENLATKVTILGKELIMMVRILKSFFLMGGDKGES